MQRRDFFKKLGTVVAVSAVAPMMSFAADEKKPKGPNEFSYEKAVEAITEVKVLKHLQKSH